ncbi:MAG: hypothetical protein K8M05_27095 [Deltaproteobacteria bacterium]|nr:hypothetical protein [Kofleriaceae bacterium]
MPSSPAHVTDPDLRLERLLALSERLHRFIARLSRAMRMEEVADIVVDDGVEALHAAGGLLWQVAPGGDRLTLLRARGVSPALADAWRDLPVDPQYPIGDAVVRRQAVWIASRAEHSRRYPAAIERTRIPGSPPPRCAPCPSCSTTACSARSRCCSATSGRSTATSAAT